jgi:hypothetical protein
VTNKETCTRTIFGFFILVIIGIVIGCIISNKFLIVIFLVIMGSLCAVGAAILGSIFLHLLWELSKKICSKITSYEG